MSVRALLHRRLVDARRVRVLTERIAAELPADARLLDVGCGDARISEGIARLRPDVEVHGLDVWQRPETAIPVTVFDGVHIPHPDASFDALVFVDVLHHTRDPAVLLREAKRVARRCIVIKDHNLDGWLAGLVIAFGGLFGDLTMSAVKRDIGVKDTGDLIPGQGGLLDRVDSLTYTAPMLFYLVYFLHG